MKSLGEILQLTATFFTKAGLSRPRLSAEELLAFVLGIKRVDLYMQFDRPLVDRELDHYRTLVKRRVKNEPLQYIMGNVDFYHSRLRLTPDVLIPRQETEILVDKICKELRPRKEALVVWDLCTGSGAIAIALKKTFPHFHVAASDLSEKALALAKENSEANGVEISFYQGDLLTPFQNKKADVIICNPPYISEKDYFTLESEVRDFEPRIALLGGVSGLEFYERLAQELPFYLNLGAKIFFEIGKDQGNSLQNLFQTPFWKRVYIEKDWAGHDRFFFLESESFSL